MSKNVTNKVNVKLVIDGINSVLVTKEDKNKLETFEIHLLLFVLTQLNVAPKA